MSLASLVQAKHCYTEKIHSVSSMQRFNVSQKIFQFLLSEEITDKHEINMNRSTISKYNEINEKFHDATKASCLQI